MITLERDGFPVELISEADWRKAIGKGYLRRDTIVTPYRRGKAGKAVRADSIAVLRALFDELDPAAVERRAQAPEPPPSFTVQPEEPAPEEEISGTREGEDSFRRDGMRLAVEARALPVAPPADPVEKVAPILPKVPAGLEGQTDQAGGKNLRTFWAVVVVLAVLFMIGRCSSQPAQIEVPPVETPSIDVPVETPVEPMDTIEEPTTYQTSFDCSGDLAAVELQICGNAYLAGRDREMAGLYARRLEQADPADDSQLAERQREWLSRRNACADLPSAEDCLRESYSNRIAELQSWRPSEDRIETESEEAPTPFVPDNSAKTIGGKPTANDAEAKPPVDRAGRMVDRSQPLRPITPNEWISIDDYPRSARNLKTPPQVGFVLNVDAQGRATNCRVTVPSASPAVDEATCRLLYRRARFHPRKGQDGKGVESTYSGTIRWEAPED